MSATSLDVFETTLQITHTWFNELMQTLGWQDKHRAYLALRATLHALRDRLTLEELAHLSAQLPMLVRGIYFEGWDPTDQPQRIRQKEGFLARIEQEFATGEPLDADRVARAVFALLTHHIAAGEIEHVKHVLPSDIRDLWP